MYDLTMLVQDCLSITLMGNSPKTPAEAIRVRQGTKIREYRTHWKLSQGELAESVGVTKAAVSEWERGVSSPRPHLQVSIAKALKAPWAIIFGLDEAA